uniref:Large ribosomal subunit protein mL46 n=1 Tax=Arcella intermedia TaxID=1963864 RepID=A0A6B2LFP4_9EUKA
MDEDVEVLKQQEEENRKREKEREKMIATETAEEREERLVREEREKRMQDIRAQHKGEVRVESRPRITEADKMNDIKSLYRKLDSKLFLIVKKKNENFWQFPEEDLLDKETLRQGAERALKENCNTETTLETYFVGNGPVTFHSFPFSKNLQTKLNTYGAKTFFLYGYFLNGKVSLSPKVVDFAWVTRNDLKQYLEPAYFEEVIKIVPRDGKHELLSKHMPNYAERKKERTKE